MNYAIEKAVNVLERYCRELNAWYSDSNYADYDLDVSMNKEMLEQCLGYLQKNMDGDARHYIQFLEEIKDGIDDVDVLEAIGEIVMYLER